MGCYLLRVILCISTTSTDGSFFLPSREDMGAILAITTETVSRIIAEFKRLGYLHALQHNALIDINQLKLLKSLKI